MLGWLKQIVMDWAAWFANLWVAFRDWAIQWIELLWAALLELFVRFFDVHLADYYNPLLNAWDFTVPYLSFVSAIFPVKMIIALWFTYTGSIATIRFARWVKSFIPFVGD